MPTEYVLTGRPEMVRGRLPDSAFGVVEKPLSTWERIYNVGGVRKLAILLVLALAWEVYARVLDNALLFPTFSATVGAFVRASSTV